MTGTEIYKRTPAYEREARDIRLHAPHWKLLLAYDGQRSLTEVAQSAEVSFAEALPLTQKFLDKKWIEEQPITLDQYLKRVGARDVSASGAAVPSAVVLHEPGKEAPAPAAPQPSAPPHAPPPLPAVPPAGKPADSPAPTAPEKTPAAKSTSRTMRLSAVVDFITSLVGNISLGQLLVYRVFLRVPPELLLAEDISSVHLVNDTSLIQGEKLQKAIADAVNAVAKRTLPDSVFAPLNGGPADGSMETTPLSSKAKHVIRPYRPEDRPILRDICADTGFLGKPIDPVFEDRELFADYLTSYYTDVEPESTFVCELNGEVKGYLMGSRFPKRKTRYEMRMLPLLVIRGLWRYFTRPYHAASRKYVRWILTQARKENPYTPPDIPHFHFNIRSEARSVGATRELVDTFFQYLYDHGEKQVYAQVVAYETRRSERTFARYGLQVIDQREVTKYREFHPGKIYLFTILKDLTLNPKLYGVDLHEKPEA